MFSLILQLPSSIDISNWVWQSPTFILSIPLFACTFSVFCFIDFPLLRSVYQSFFSPVIMYLVYHFHALKGIVMLSKCNPCPHTIFVVSQIFYSEVLLNIIVLKFLFIYLFIVYRKLMPYFECVSYLACHWEGITKIEDTCEQWYCYDLSEYRLHIGNQIYCTFIHLVTTHYNSQSHILVFSVRCSLH